ncbi:uncharacterized protein LOC110687608 [Chenopodium quinoa]|nr:uncharacterized protein LOC110687608 [Chenopodium quinoa]
MHEFRLNNIPSTSEPKPKRLKTNDHDGTSQSQGSKPKNMLDGWVLCKVYRVARDVEVEAINQEEQHLHQEEQHQAIALNIGANDHVLIPAIEDSFEHLQRNRQEEQHLQQEEQHQAIALNNGDNHHLLIPEIEDSFEHQQRNEDMPRFSQEELEFLYNIFPC